MSQHVCLNFTLTHSTTVPLVRRGRLSWRKAAVDQGWTGAGQEGLRILRFLILTSPPHPDCGLRGSQSMAAPWCDVLSPDDSESPGHAPWEFYHLAAADSFWLAEVFRAGQTQHSLRVADSQVCTHIAARGVCECVSTLAGRPGLAIHRLSSW